jgi:hypothetical protein
MEHNDIRDKLSEYIDGSITAQEKTEIEEHLKTCETCKDALQELRKTIEHVKAIDEVEPPSWMAQKIMAKVRVEAEEKKKGLFGRFFLPISIKPPIQAVAVLFLAVTAFYIYRSIQPASVPSEAPIQEFAAKKEAPSAGIAKDKMAKADESAYRSKKVRQTPEYKALDMKLEYEKPAPPVPQEQPAATVPAPAKRDFDMAENNEASREKQLTTPKAKAAAPLQAGKTDPLDQLKQRSAAGLAAPATMAEQASGTAATPGADFASVPRTEDKDAEEILSVMEHFVRYDLQDAMKTKGLQYSARRVPKDLAGLQWLRDSTAYRSSTCSRKYLVDVEFSGKSSKYLYCYEQNKPRLLTVYELKAGTWVEQK